MESKECTYLYTWYMIAWVYKTYLHTCVIDVVYGIFISSFVCILYGAFTIYSLHDEFVVYLALNSFDYVIVSANAR